MLELGNVFEVVYHDKIFVGEINAEGDRKMIRFKMMLERRPGYYVTKVAIPAAIITYLCFTSYASLENGSLIETGDRLQIVLTLLLTAVMFKNQEASLTPRISYFTTLDRYVFFFCFVVGCLVAIEIALFPVAAKYFSTQKFWQEQKLLWVSVGFFTLVNVVCIVAFVKMRKWASKVLLNVHEDIRVIAATIPAEHREAVLYELLEQSHYQSWELPSIRCTEFGYLYVQLPVDGLSRTKNADKKRTLHESSRQKAEQKSDAVKKIYSKLNPSGLPLETSSRSSQKNDFASTQTNGSCSRRSSAESDVTFPCNAQ